MSSFIEASNVEVEKNVILAPAVRDMKPFA
jgi:hypothetical protein